MPFRWVDGFQRFDETCHVHLQGLKVQGHLKPLTMEEARSFETSGTTHSARAHHGGTGGNGDKVPFLNLGTRWR